MLKSDPELAAGIQNPRIVQAMQSLSIGGGMTAEAMNDPVVASFLQKLSLKIGPMVSMCTDYKHLR